MVKVRIYAEGGGEKGQSKKGLDIMMRAAFKTFIMKALQQTYPYQEPLERSFIIEACGSRIQAYDSFCHALAQRISGDTEKKGEVLLLVDSESEVAGNIGPWTHLKKREGDGWERPNGAMDEHVHLMVQFMETWFLADPKNVASYFGKNFNKRALPVSEKIEKVPKDKVLQYLNNAARKTSKKIYDKGDSSFGILEKIDPCLVQIKSPWCCRFLKVLDDILVHGKMNSSIRQCDPPAIIQGGPS
ncbi:MAG: DUF4276 family protein [Magnetococcales bacterium]|nr:DUF4276 family protein [Magnetococcales bacterium]